MPTLDILLRQTRFWLKDLDTEVRIWKDREIETNLIMSTVASRAAQDPLLGNPMFAAAVSFLLAANDAAQLAVIESVAIFKTDNRNLPTALREAAESLLPGGMLFTLFGQEYLTEVGFSIGEVSDSREDFPRTPSNTPASTNDFVKW